MRICSVRGEGPIVARFAVKRLDCRAESVPCAGGELPVKGAAATSQYSGQAAGVYETQCDG